MRTAWNKGKFQYHDCKGCKNPVRKWQTFCNFQCYINSKKGQTLITKVCNICQQNFEVTLRLKTKKYCSKKCGQIGWKNANSGKRHWLYGKKQSQDVKQKISLARQGKNLAMLNPNWKGGITSEDRLERIKFRRLLQKLIFQRDNYQCQLCDVHQDLQVDHIQSWAEFKELRFDPDNCRTLCAKCHYKITFGRKMPNGIKAWGHNLLKGENIL